MRFVRINLASYRVIEFTLFFLLDCDVLSYNIVVVVSLREEFLAWGIFSNRVVSRTQLV
jgi:hypothetical protein